jgi:phosphoglycerate dehydrogenase-like enzyme
MTPIKLVAIDKPGASHLKPFDSLPASVNLVVSNQLNELQQAVQDADVILNGFPAAPLFKQAFGFARRLRWVHSLSAGVEKILFPELIASPVVLTNARGVFKRSLSEFVMASVLHFAKDLRRLIRNQQAGVWEQFQMLELHGKAMGVIGYGEIGHACAQRAHDFGMKILGLRRRPELSKDDPLLAAVFGPDELHRLLAESDYVVLAAPSTPLTKKLLGKAEFAAMKPSAVFINIGRGTLVDEAALIEALKEGRIHGAALDVFETEPLPAGHPLFQLENLLLSPHCADHTPGFYEMDLEFFIENLHRFLKGEPLVNIVDKQAGY